MPALCARCTRPVADALVLCGHCIDALAEALLAVPVLAAELEITRAGLGRASGVRTGGRSTETALPIRASGVGIVGDRTLAALNGTLITWARAVGEEFGAVPAIGLASLVDLTHARTGAGHRDPAALLPHPYAFAQCAVWLSEHIDHLRGYEAVAELLADVERALDQITAIIDRGERRPVGLCPAVVGETACGAEVYARPDNTYARCRRCMTQHAVVDLERAARVAAEDRAYTRTEIARLTAEFGCSVSTATVHRWASRGRIQPRAWQHHGDNGIRIVAERIAETDRPLYRLGDVLELALAAHAKGETTA